jgi:hypothetical protein
MKARREAEVWLYALFDLGATLRGVGGGQRHAPGRLTRGKRPGTPCARGWVGPRVGADGRGKSRPYQDSIPGPSSPSLYRQRYPAPQVRWQLFPDCRGTRRLTYKRQPSLHSCSAPTALQTWWKSPDAQCCLLTPWFT